YARPISFDMLTLTLQHPLSGRGWVGGAVLAAVGVGLAIKTPTVPFHTWLPPAHTQAPAAGSAILAGVLLKMGTYGFVRIAMPMLPQQWRQYAWLFIVVGVISVIYGALVALAQQDFKAMIAYTSVNHMGYILLALGTAGLLGGTDAQVRTLAVAGAVTQMVSHGLITGALFLLSGVLRDRGGTYAMADYSGLAGQAPRFTALMGIGFFASLGLPAFSGFIAEFQIFTGSIAAAPVATGIAVLGIVLTAALFLMAFGRMMLGELKLPAGRNGRTEFADLEVAELVPIAALLVLSLLIGVLPRLLLDVLKPGARAVVDLVGR
ncbi:MAG: NADH-quinone oxidoreductase subunit M, partial [Actinomycetota bacterium]|nr:NADH-quinone oxidoreductase subunit M [Actinomycetota bacterium]